MSSETDKLGEVKPNRPLLRSATISKIPVTPTQSIPSNRSRQSTQPLLERNISYGNMLAPSTRTEAKVLVIYTGGTIGMMRNDKDGKRVNIIILKTFR